MHEAGEESAKSTVPTQTARGAEKHLAGLSRALRGGSADEQRAELGRKGARCSSHLELHGLTQAVPMARVACSGFKGRAESLSRWEGETQGSGYGRLVVTGHMEDLQTALICATSGSFHDSPSTQAPRASLLQNRPEGHGASPQSGCQDLVQLESAQSRSCFARQLRAVNKAPCGCVDHVSAQARARCIRGGGPTQKLGALMTDIVADVDCILEKLLPKPSWQRETFAAQLLSVLSMAALESRLHQSWVAEWHGWKEIAAATAEEELNALWQRFSNLLRENAPLSVHSEADALQALREAGWEQIVALPHDANNCLIDAIILSLASRGLLDAGYRPGANVAFRERLCWLARAHLATTVDADVAAEAGRHPYLDAELHGPSIVKFLLRALPAAAESVVLVVRSRLDNDVAHPRHVIAVCPERGSERNCVALHLYNHTHANGQGYHFDALWYNEERSIAAGSYGPQEPLSSHECSASSQNETDAALIQAPTNYSSTAGQSITQSVTARHRALAHKQSLALLLTMALRPVKHSKATLGRKKKRSWAMPRPRQARTLPPSAACCLGTHRRAAMKSRRSVQWRWKHRRHGARWRTKSCGSSSKWRPCCGLPRCCHRRSTDMCAPSAGVAGVAYPAAHCAFAGCTWCSEMQPCDDALGHGAAWAVQGVEWHRLTGTCCGNTETCLWAHLAAKHRDSLAQGCRRARSGGSGRAHTCRRSSAERKHPCLRWGGVWTAARSAGSAKSGARPTAWPWCVLAAQECSPAALAATQGT